jgi:hypothetical protein
MIDACIMLGFSLLSVSPGVEAHLGQPLIAGQQPILDFEPSLLPVIPDGTQRADTRSRRQSVVKQ